ncbi:Abi family protein [Vagococcus lutrae]|nr:Abi family protein [Vagococcus lutrae]PQW15007.1 DNA-binding protein [Enterococcus faecalis]UQF12780.1 Abi family protein [Vagococcus lutrae]
MIGHMKDKGIKFDLMSESEALNVLKQNTYYYKVTSYRKNYTQQSGMYENLDFAFLADLGKIDMRLRYFILETALDYEHSIKTKLLDLITSDHNEDGYQIVEEFRTKHPSTYKIVMKNLRKNKYLKDMYLKRHSNPAIWVILEVMTFGSLSVFIDFYYEKNKTKSLKPAYNLTKYAKNIRNAAAHSNPLLLNLYEPHSLINVDQSVVSYAHIMGISAEKIVDRKVNDLVSLFYLHSNYCSEGMNKHKKEEGIKLIDRCLRNKEYYEEVYSLQEMLNIFNKCVDYL